VLLPYSAISRKTLSRKSGTICPWELKAEGNACIFAHIYNNHFGKKKAPPLLHSNMRTPQGSVMHLGRCGGRGAGERGAQNKGNCYFGAVFHAEHTLTIANYQDLAQSLGLVKLHI
jgi:hypothetical protein